MNKTLKGSGSLLKPLMGPYSAFFLESMRISDSTLITLLEAYFDKSYKRFLDNCFQSVILFEKLF